MMSVNIYDGQAQTLKSAATKLQRMKNIYTI